MLAGLQKPSKARAGFDGLGREIPSFQISYLLGTPILVEENIENAIFTAVLPDLRDVFAPFQMGLAELPR